MGTVAGNSVPLEAAPIVLAGESDDLTVAVASLLELGRPVERLLPWRAPGAPCALVVVDGRSEEALAAAAGLLLAAPLVPVLLLGGGSSPGNAALSGRCLDPHDGAMISQEARRLIELASPRPSSGKSVRAPAGLALFDKAGQLRACDDEARKLLGKGEMLAASLGRLLDADGQELADSQQPLAEAFAGRSVPPELRCAPARRFAGPPAARDPPARRRGGRGVRGPLLGLRPAR